MKKFLLGAVSCLGLLVLMGQTRPDIYARLALWDGAAFQDSRMASLTNLTPSTTLTARNIIGAELAEKASRWIVQSAPAAGSVGSASIAAEAGVRHVADCVGLSADSTGAVTAAAATIVLRDGATGAGTILLTFADAVATAAAAGVEVTAPFAFCGLGLIGTTNTAMTFEYNAGVTNVVQAVWLSGYNVQ